MAYHTGLYGLFDGFLQIHGTKWVVSDPVNHTISIKISQERSIYFLIHSHTSPAAMQLLQGLIIDIASQPTYPPIRHLHSIWAHIVKVVSPACSITLRVRDMIGRTILRTPVNLTRGTNYVPVPSGNWATGIYFFEFLTGAGQKFTKRVLKNHD